LFIAAGRQTVRQPRISGADLPGVIDALSFLCAARMGVKRELAQNVAVLGNENIAVDAAILARELGAENVYLLTGRKAEEVGAASQRISEACERGVHIATNRKVLEILGEGRVESLRVPPGPAGIIRSHGDEVEELPHVLEVGTVILAGEREPSPALLEYLAGQLKVTPEGNVRVDPDTLATSRAGVFAGGEIAGGDGLVVSACDQGRRAAISIDRYLKSKSAAQPLASRDEAAHIS
jgi:glutamate synthase (NADPH/NADH) small chain